jgi:dTDP-glucose 4,6-dehydratase
MFSTDEVFGPAPEGVAFKEWDRYNSTNPYSATKAASEELALAWGNTYNIPMIVTHCMNNFGERQHPEKFIPSVVKKLLSGQLIHVHSNPSKTRPGTRNYIHARNVAAAVLHIIQNVVDNSSVGKIRDKYNITGEREVDNLTLVNTIHKIMEKELKKKLELNVELVDFHSSRPGHDLAYRLDGSKLASLGWKPPTNFDESLERTIRWMIDSHHLSWLMID